MLAKIGEQQEITRSSKTRSDGDEYISLSILFTGE